MAVTAAQRDDWLESVMPRCEQGKGSLGSDVFTVRGGDPRMLQAAIDVFSKRFRKGWIDLSQRIAVFMAPSSIHELASEDMSDLVKSLCLAHGLAVVSMSSSTRHTQDRRRSLEPDESFLIGETAARFLRLKAKEGLDAALQDLGDQPPDLAVEIERTNYDAGKVEIYRAVGVRELWELTAGGKPRTPRILDLQAPEAARTLHASRLLPGVRADCLPAALAELSRVGGAIAFAREMDRDESVVKRLLAVAGKAAPPVR